MGLGDWVRNLRGPGRRDSFAPGELPPPDRIPFHVGIIMDGNGRWASRRRVPVQAGHRAGVGALKKTVKAARRFGVSQVTVFSWSTENWNRPRDEVDGVLSLVSEVIDREVDELDAQGVKLVFVGRREGLDSELRRKMAAAESRTAGNQLLTLFIAFNYGGRAEVVDAVREAVAGGVDAAQLSEDDVARHLYAPEMRDPDLIIRTSGEHRLSNFLLWESAYSELYFSEALWPDFDEEHFARALRDYASRERRFGSREASSPGARDLA